jgi:hypothetical protein
MNDPAAPLAADRLFFSSLLAGGVSDLDRLLDDDFLLIDVLSGGEVGKPVLLAALGAGHLRFDSIDPAEIRVRLYGATAVVTGRTHMTGRFADAPFEARSRYTHVYVRSDPQPQPQPQQQGGWRLVSAQGTPIRG